MEKVRSTSLVVRLDGTGERVRVSPAEITNFGLAARKAWERMPDRRVGRPKGFASSSIPVVEPTAANRKP